MQLSFKEHFQFIPKFVRLKIEDVLFEKAYMSPRSTPKIFYFATGKKNSVQKLIDNQKGNFPDNQKDKLLDKQNSSNQPN